MKKIAVLICLLLFMPITAHAIEIQRVKGVATKVMFPLIDSANNVTFKTGATGFMVKISYWDDGTAPSTFTNIDNQTLTEVATNSGWYYVSLNATEMNHDYIAIEANATSTQVQGLEINTIPRMVANAINATVNYNNGTLVSVNDTVTKANITTTAINNTLTTTNATAAAVKTQTDKMAFTTANKIDARAFTVDDKTGYSISGTKTTLDALNDVTAAIVWNYNISTMSTSGLAGTYLKGAGSAGDPWTTALPGAYGAGTAGYIIGNNIDAKISTRSSLVASDVWNATSRTLSDYSGVWSVATRLLTAGTNIVLAKGTGITGFNDITVDNIWGNATRTITGGVTVTTNNDKTGYTVSTVSDKTGYSLAPAERASIGDAVWNITRTGHTNAGTFGLYLDAQVSTVGGGTLTAGDIWNYTISGYSTAGQAGTYLKGAGAAGDPWITALPGAYTEGTAGYLMDKISQYTNATKDGGDYNGIEKMIRSNR